MPEAVLAELLQSAGWRSTDKGWKHRRLTFEWPIRQAYRLQTEADAGMQDLAHRILRGED